MKLIKIGAAGIGVLLIAVVVFAAYGLPVRGLIKTYSQDALAKNELELDIGGDAWFAIWPNAGVTIEQVRLRDPKGVDDLITVERVRAGVSLTDLLRGRIRIDEIALTRPIVKTEPMFGRAKRMAARRVSSSPGATAPIVLPGAHSAVAIDAITATDGKVILRDGRETADVRFDDIKLVAMPAVAGRSSLHLNARFGDTNVRLVAGMKDPARLADGEPVSVDATIDAPAALKSPASVTALVAKTGPVIKVEGLNGTIDQGRVRGSMSISFAGAKPFVDATLQSERIDLTNIIDAVTNAERAMRSDARAAAPPPDISDPNPQRGGTEKPATRTDAVPPWSDAPLNFFGLRLFDANINLSAREVVLEKTRVAPAALEATLLQDTLTLKLSPSGVYGGQAAGELTVDRSQETPAFAMRMAFSAIDALQALRDINSFDHVSGRARGALDLKSSGISPLRIVSNLNGRAEFLVEDGAVRGLNMPAMVRSLLDMVLSGWQQRATAETRFNSFGGTFSIEKGVARSTDIKFNGPLLTMTAAGSVDLRAQTLDFRADPRILSSRDPSTGRQTSSGIGVPVVIKGAWSEPRIYADTPDILSNTDGALRALRNALGVGSGGGSGSTGDDGRGSDAGGTDTQSGAALNNFIQGLSKGFGQATGDPARDGGRIAEELLKALGATRSATVPQPETTAPRSGVTPPQTATPRSAPAPSPDRDLDRGAREILRDLLGR
ncbi:MAG: AsmA family protein [Xanthobacteraceae bacterium]